MTATFYTQHNLTQADLDRDAAKERAIARNRAKAAAKRTAGAPKIMSEMRYHGDKASDAQKDLVERLLKKLEVVNPTVHAQASSWWTGVRDTITKGDISGVINRIKTRIAEAEVTPPVHTPTQPQYTPRDKFSDVPDGYYAVPTDDEDNHLAFYRVSTWKGSGDRKVQVQASDTLHPMKGRKAADGVLAKVREVGSTVAGKLYADHLGNCYRCGRTLTDAESRSLGIGPVCRDK